jgi:hypothetical protein
MKKIAFLAIALILVATTSIAQEAQEEPMYVSLTYLTLKPGMDEAFMAAAADHLAWRKSINDTHYYSVSRVTSGARSGQIMFAAGPMTGTRMDEYNAFGETSMADWGARGAFNYVERFENIVLQTMPGLGNPPPPGTMTPMVHVFELDIDYAQMMSFMEALNEMDELENSIGPAGYNVWVMPVTGTAINKRWVVNWVEGWADTAESQNPERQAKLLEAAGGADAFQALVTKLMGAIVDSNVTTYMSMPAISFVEGQ